jgi:hypothetical protein
MSKIHEQYMYLYRRFDTVTGQWKYAVTVTKDNGGVFYCHHVQELACISRRGYLGVPLASFLCLTSSSPWRNCENPPVFSLTLGISPSTYTAITQQLRRPTRHLALIIQ